MPSFSNRERDKYRESGGRKFVCEREERKRVCVRERHTHTETEREMIPCSK